MKSLRYQQILTQLIAPENIVNNQHWESFRSYIRYKNVCFNFLKVQIMQFYSNVFYVLFCTIICIIFTSLCKNLVKLTWVTQVSLTRFLQSEVKIIHIIVQNNTYYSARSRWTKQQQQLFTKSRKFPSSVMMFLIPWLTWQFFDQTAFLRIPQQNVKYSLLSENEHLSR